MIELTETLIASIKLSKEISPFRIIWVCKDKESGKVEVYAATSRRPINKAAREGHTVAVIQFGEMK